jgi:dienelactone hydrolase
MKNINDIRILDYKSNTWITGKEALNLCFGIFKGYVDKEKYSYNKDMAEQTLNYYKAMPEMYHDWNNNHTKESITEKQFKQGKKSCLKYFKQ